METSSTSERFVENGYITCSYLVAKTFGNNAAMFLEYLMGWGAGKDWRHRTSIQIEDDINLSAQEQRTARTRLKDAGVLHEKIVGLPAQLHFLVDWSKAIEAMESTPDRPCQSTNKLARKNQQTSSQESTNKLSNFNKHIKELSQRDLVNGKEELTPTPLGNYADDFEQTFGESSKAKKELPTNGVAQQIVAAYCAAAGIDKPALYAKAVGQAATLAKAGITLADIPSLYAFAAEWKGTADLGMMLNQVDRWRAKPPVQTGVVRNARNQGGIGRVAL